jgi:hypothetical protein
MNGSRPRVMAGEGVVGGAAGASPTPAEMIDLPHLCGIKEVEKVREWSTYRNHSFGLLLYSIAHAKCQVPTKREEQTGEPDVRRIVEIGYFIGYSALMFTAAVADSGKPGKVISVDRLDQEAGRYFMAIQDDLRHLHDLVIGDSASMVDEVMQRLGGPIDVLLIDGDHSYQGCRRDYDAYSPRLAEDGVLLFHDNYNRDVRRVLDEIARWNFVNLGGWAGLTMGTRTSY